LYRSFFCSREIGYNPFLSYLNIEAVQGQNYGQIAESNADGTADIVAGTVELEAISQNIELSHSSPSRLSVHCSAGRTELLSLQTDRIEIYSQAGKIRGNDLKTNYLHAEVQAGKIELNRISGVMSAKLSTQAGKIFCSVIRSSFVIASVRTGIGVCSCSCSDCSPGSRSSSRSCPLALSPDTDGLRPEVPHTAYSRPNT